MKICITRLKIKLVWESVIFKLFARISINRDRDEMKIFAVAKQKRRFFHNNSLFQKTFGKKSLS